MPEGITPETIARYREKYARVIALMARKDDWTKDDLLAVIELAFGGVKTIPKLLDEIERLQHLTTPHPE